MTLSLEPSHRDNSNEESQRMFLLRNKKKTTAIAAMRSPHSVFDIGHCTVIHCDAGDVLLFDQ